MRSAAAPVFANELDVDSLLTPTKLLSQATHRRPPLGYCGSDESIDEDVDEEAIEAYRLPVMPPSSPTSTVLLDMDEITCVRYDRPGKPCNSLLSSSSSRYHYIPYNRKPSLSPDTDHPCVEGASDADVSTGPLATDDESEQVLIGLQFLELEADPYSEYCEGAVLSVPALIPVPRSSSGVALPPPPPRIAAQPQRTTVQEGKNEDTGYDGDVEDREDDPLTQLFEAGAMHLMQLTGTTVLTDCFFPFNASTTPPVSEKGHDTSDQSFVESTYALIYPSRYSLPDTEEGEV